MISVTLVGLDIITTLPLTNVSITSHHDFLKNFIYFRERESEREREAKKHGSERYTSISCLSLTPNWGTDLQPRHEP